MLDDLDGIDCFDDDEDDGLGGLDGDALADLGALDLAHEMTSRRGALDRHAARYGLEAVNKLMARGLDSTARLGVRVAVVPDELARFMQADDAFWIHLMCGLWYNQGDVCGASRRDDLGDLEEWCMLAPHDPGTPHGFEVLVDGGRYLRVPAVTW